MKSSVFTFKQFSIRQENSAMKVGTDGVLLGAWAKIPLNAEKILDIGTGTGLIALMLAQRFSTLSIDALEIDAQAYKEALHNFSQSRWFNRLNGIHSSLNDFTNNTTTTYDAIVCNPPFFIDGYAIENSRRDKARSNHSMTYASLFKAVDTLLNPFGMFSMIIPIAIRDQVIKFSEEVGFNLAYETKVRGNEKAPFKRCLFAFTRENRSQILSDLTLELERNKRTRTHQELVDAFYLSRT